MIFEVLLFLLMIIVFYYLSMYIKLQAHFTKCGVKFLPGVPFFGNMLQSSFLKRHFLDDMDEVYQAFPDEKYVGFMEFTLPIIMVKDPELIKSIIVKDFDHFTDHREFFSEESDPLFAGSLLLMKGERWRHMRATLSPAFTASKMKQMMPFVLEITNNIVDYLDDQQGLDVGVDDLMRRYTSDVIASAGFGLQINSLKDRDNEFYKVGHTIFDFDLRQRMLLMLVTQFPEFGKKLGFRLFTDEVYQFFSNIVTATIAHRKKNNIVRPDMIQLLMEAKGEWTSDELTGQVFIFFTAGFETSASALTLAMHELAIHPDAQEKLYQECRKFKEEKELTFENLNELKYMDAVINETLRKWTPAIIFDRTCTKTYELPPPREGGKPYTIKRGEVLYNLVNHVQMDPKYWPEPHRFDPERFSEENKPNIKPFTFMPFGIGPRGCIGLRFAMMELKVLMYHLILKYKIVKTAKTSDPIKMLPHNINIRALGGTNAQFERRLPL